MIRGDWPKPVEQQQCRRVRQEEGVPELGARQRARRAAVQASHPGPDRPIGSGNAKTPRTAPPHGRGEPRPPAA
jgi:hypothetical protein